MGRTRFIVLAAVLAAAVPSLPAVAAAADAPSITKVSPAYGTTRGGTTVTLTGTHFDHVRAVRFGGTAATFHRVSSTQLTATTPAHAAGQVAVAVVTASGTGKGAYQYANPAPRPVGAGYIVPHADAKSGNLRVVVPQLTCARHENSELGALIEPVQKLRLGEFWAGRVAFRCVNGAARYRASMVCGGGPGDDAGALRPGDTVDISYAPGQVGMSISDGRTGTGTGCGWVSAGGPSTAGNEPAVAFLVKSLSTPPTALHSLTVRARAGGAPLSADHPRPQNQTLSPTTQLKPGRIGADGKSFTVRVQPR